MAVSYEWGLDQPVDPAAIAHANAVVAGLSLFELPEVRELLALGWELSPDAPMLAFLPAIWPSNLRTWVPDRATRYEERYERDLKNHGPWRGGRTVMSQGAKSEIEADIDHLLARAGIYGRPRGRAWLLKPPCGFRSVDDIIEEINRRADASNTPIVSSAAYVQIADAVIR